MLASHFFPDKFLLILFAYLIFAVLIVGLSLWACRRFGGSRLWVTSGMFLGGIGAVTWYVGLLPIGIVVGAVGGSVIGIIVATVNK